MATRQIGDLLDRLKQLAWKRSIPFCYSCHRDAPSGRCNRCMSDDLMRLVPGVGCEFGIEWVVQHLLETQLDPLDLDEAFEESLRGCYPETTQVGWLTVDTVDTIKEVDPIAFDLARDEWVDAELSDGSLVTFDNGGSHYYVHDVEQFLDEAEAAETPTADSV